MVLHFSDSTILFLLIQLSPVKTPTGHEIPLPSTDAVVSAEPNVFKHYKRRKNVSALAQRRYKAPPNQAGLRLSSVIGYNGCGRNNLVWQPETGEYHHRVATVNFFISPKAQWSESVTPAGRV